MFQDDKPIPKKKPVFQSEAELALVVEKYLKAKGWEVFKEVKPKSLSRIADIVALKDNKIWIIETKLVYGTKVLDQAAHWLHYAHYVSIAVPKGDSHSLVLNHFMNHFGIGKLDLIPANEFGSAIVRENRPPKLNEKVMEIQIYNSLHHQQKDSVAGVKGGGYVTPYKLTIQAIKHYLKYNPGKTIGEIVNSIQHHYTSHGSAMSALPKMLLEIEDDFYSELIDGKRHFYLKK